MRELFSFTKLCITVAWHDALNCINYFNVSDYMQQNNVDGSWIFTTGFMSLNQFYCDATSLGVDMPERWGVTLWFYLSADARAPIAFRRFLIWLYQYWQFKSITKLPLEAVGGEEEHLNFESVQLHAAIPALGLYFTQNFSKIVGCLASPRTPMMSIKRWRFFEWKGVNRFASLDIRPSIIYCWK
jgi:hypothetical protein